MKRINANLSPHAIGIALINCQNRGDDGQDRVNNEGMKLNGANGGHPADLTDLR